MFDLDTKEFFVSPDVKFVEEVFLFKSQETIHLPNNASMGGDINEDFSVLPLDTNEDLRPVLEVQTHLDVEPVIPTPSTCNTLGTPRPLSLILVLLLHTLFRLLFLRWDIVFVRSFPTSSIGIL